ncbi:MAG TPA: asparagine synthase (glutamine-hydrolyzing) [Acidimicrobiia bacterium]|nr:asparagine synthase (glutamine-hydrolyzing) [Acidimicrobiia bacterium]
MCGVSGFWGPPDRALLEAMTAAQVHRGPDDLGFLETAVASLGFRRLSIIDLAGGHQPMSTDDGLVHISYNGEVYNFRELRAELEALGHEFHTTCDTEVLLHAYAEWGTECFARCNGMWGVALLDERGDRPRLVLARDHFGIKPMYYAPHGDRVLFASEIKAILQDPTFPRRVDEQRMYEYLAYGLFDHTEATFFDGVRTVPAAAYAIVDDEGVRVERYWQPVLSEDGSGDPAEFRAVFERAVERRLVADVPVGICLSGGLDSSSICTVMARQLEEHVPDSVSLGDRLQTFSAVFPGDPIDETHYIDAVLGVTGAATSRCEPTAKDFVREMEPWVWHIEEPMVSSAPFAMWMVMRLAREKVTVTLDGQGGDELLGGYDHYPYVYLRELLKQRRYRTFAHEAWRSRDVVGPLIRRRLRQRRHPVPVRDLLRPEFARSKRAPVDDRVDDDLKRRLLQDFTTYSLPPLLRYEDRASMAHSLEARLPFLDQELVEHILALPPHAIIEHGWNRRALREGLRDTLPEIVYTRRKKIGFTTPEFRWYRRERAVLNGLLNSPSFASRPYWDAPAVAQAFRRACNGEVEESMFFWRAINAEVWMRIFFDDGATTLDGDSYRAGFVARGDRWFARGKPYAEELLRRARPNAGNPLFLHVDDDVYARIPLRSRVIAPGDDVVDAILDAAEGVTGIADADLVLVSEKALSISQGNALPVAEIATSRAARLLSRFVSRSPVGVGLGHPATMQLAIDEVGLGRILLAAVAGAVTRPFGLHGVFYRVAGGRVNAIDGPSAANLPPYDTWACKAPSDCEGEVRRIASSIAARRGRKVDVAVIDANDLAAEVFATTPGVDPDTVLRLVVDNPLGQSAEQTPFGLVRRVG